jgi:outer membrane receptor protein involved in Fe transport
VTLTLRRDVSQLDFEDFVAYIDPWDDEIRAGNPDLLPETSWDLEVGSEHHFDENAGLLKLSLFHRWVEDVNDLILLEPDDSQPGNLPDGRHWGVQADFGIRLDRLGISNAVINGSYKWQDSETTDPFTGETRPFQGQERYEASLEFRHDLERLRGAYGFSWSAEGREYRFDVDRTDVDTDAGSVQMFIERRIGRSLILKLSARQLHEPLSRRTRLNYDPDRATGIRDTREIRSSTWSRSVTLTLSGTF